MNTRGAIALQSKNGARRDTVVAAAQVMRVGRERILPTKETWQDEVWEYYDERGVYRFAVQWLANMVSRCRLTAARSLSGGDEPEILRKATDADDAEDADELTDAEGLAVELVQELAGGITGQVQLLETLTTFLTVPGEGYVIGEERDGENAWEVRSADEIQGYGSETKIISEDSTPGHVTWRPLRPNSMFIRVWRPHKRLRHVADSPSRAARDTLRELTLVSRRIIAEYLSRLASAGLIIFPDEITFPVREELQDEDDPFMAEWIETAREAIAAPGTAAAVVPLPIRVPGELVDKVRHIDFTLKIDEKLLEKRDSALRQLATELDMPAEIITGMGETNHWSAWQIEESAIKIHISPVIELICHALTAGYLRPRLKAAGVDPAGVIIWYDTSELKVQPDRTAAAFQAYDRNELSGDSLRAATGFGAGDKPSDEELLRQVLLYAARQPQTLYDALYDLELLERPSERPASEVPTVSPSPTGNGELSPEVEVPTTGPPGTRDEPPPPPDEMPPGHTASGDGWVAVADDDGRLRFNEDTRKREREPAPT